ncbi:MAG: mannitol dehydrogenase family protein [Tissierellia bacterium]|nr:mannitol dehydrogenase family protein [Tissierellia bacterium]
MELKLESLKEKKVWEEAGFSLPQFDLDKVSENTSKAPNWIHFGAGNIFRAFLANVQQNILNEGKSDRGIIAVGGNSIKSVYHEHDNLTVLVTLKVDGSIEKRVIGSVTEAIVLDASNESYWNRLKEIFRNPSLQMVSFTITEKGYKLTDSQGEYLADVREDFKNGLESPRSYLGKVVSLLYERYLAGKHPIALVSMDNMSQNGSKLYESVSTYVSEWTERGLVEQGFKAYVDDRNSVSFPWSMIDKITPRPDPAVKEMLREAGFKDVEDKITENKGYAAPFVNAEELEYLVIEDDFPNGRPNLEEGGVIFTDRETVDKVEKMKVGTCLNPLHTALAIFGCLLGFDLISKEMADPDLRRLVEKIGYEEAFPVVVNPGILDPKEFIDEVLNIRFPNPFMPDTPQRIATDTSQKLGIRFGETIKAYISREDLDVKDLKFIPLVLAAWCRYLMGIDDKGEKIELSPDPLLEELLPHLEGISLGDRGPFHEQLKPVLSNANIFGIDLYEAGLGEKVEGYFEELVAEEGAVRKTLQKYLHLTDQ